MRLCKELYFYPLKYFVHFVIVDKMELKECFIKSALKALNVKLISCLSSWDKKKREEGSAVVQ